MNFIFWKNILINRFRSSPSRKFKVNLWRRLDVMWSGLEMPNYFWYQKYWFRFSVSAMIVVIIFTSVATGAYAYSSPEVTEDTVLYPIKQNLEKIVEIVKVTPTAKAEYVIIKIDRREAEKAIMIKRGAQVVKMEQSIASLEEKLEKMDVIMKATNKNAEKIMEKMQARLAARRIKLQKAAEQINVANLLPVSSTIIINAVQIPSSTIKGRNKEGKPASKIKAVLIESSEQR